MAGVEREIKLSKFEKEIKNQKNFNEFLISLFSTEYGEIIDDILNLKEELFIDQIKEGVCLALEDIYTAYCLTDQRMMKLITKNIEEIKNKYKQDFSLVNTALINFEKNTKKRSNNFLTSSFRKHCINTEEILSHNCLSQEKDGEKNCRFIVVNDNNSEMKFVFCENCKKVYYSSFILARCYKCKVDYYTSLLYPEENPEMLLATWENYHCPQLINEKMKCINCHEYFYLNMKNGLLTCLNKKCAFISKPNRILWTCCTCKKEFKSGAIPYNPLDIHAIKKLIVQTLILKHKAHPKKMDCGCKLNVFFTDFFHNKKCKGILYQSELDDNTIIVCDKCKMITYIDRFIWTCPKCEKKFKNGIIVDEKSPNLNLSENENSEEIHVSNVNTFDKKSTEKNIFDNNINSNSPQPKHIKYASKRLKDYKLKQEKKLMENNKLKEKENKEKEEEEKKEKEKEKEESKVINGGWKHRRYSKNHPISNKDEINNNDNKEKENEINQNDNNDKEKEEKKPEEKKYYRKFGYKEKPKIKTDFTDLHKDKDKDKIDEKQKEKGNNYLNINVNDDKTNQRYISPRNMWKKRFYHFNNTNKENEEKDKDKEKETSPEPEPEPKKKEKIKFNLNLQSILQKNNIEPPSPKENQNQIQLQTQDKNNNSNINTNKTSKSNKSNNINSTNEEKEDSINSLNDSNSNLSLTEEEEEEEETQIKSPRNKKLSFLKKKTNGIVLNETEFLNALESPRKRKKKNAPQIQVKIAMSKIPGVSEHLFNHINKRMTSILNRCKIPVFNIEDYVFNKKVGEGAFGVIFSVFKKDDEEQKQFALKKIIAKTLTEIDKFTKEFEIMHNLDHENIMKIYGICIRILDQTTYALYVLMELSERDWDKDIRLHIAKKKFYSEKKLIKILSQITKALLFIQKTAKISHRDIKPQNVLIFNNDTYKIANINSEINTLKGTELFMSPALYSGLKHEKNDVSHDPYKSDIFSLGFCFLYAATLNFDLLYKVRDIYNSNMMNKVIEENLKNKYSDTFVYILKKMLDTDEEERFNFEQLVDFVENKYDQEGNLKEENSDNGNKNININKENNRGKFSPIRKKFKK